MQLRSKKIFIIIRVVNLYSWIIIEKLKINRKKISFELAPLSQEHFETNKINYILLKCMSS